MKTKKTLAKRIKITKTGKVLKKQNNKGHLNRKFDANKQQRKKALQGIPNHGYLKKIKVMLGKQGRHIDITNTSEKKKI